MTTDFDDDDFELRQATSAIKKACQSEARTYCS